ncbi:MAG: lantibiotic dehydratase [Chitinophagaceae bacterium]|nr:lantibiotic dehydratase [Chitinophagaceae bacterium]
MPCILEPEWGSMANQFSFLPRLVYKDVILFEATWQLSRKNFEILLQNPITENTLSIFIEKWKLPRYITLVDNDNKLLVDLQSKNSVETFFTLD